MPIAAASATPGTADRGIFELDRADPLAARLDHVLGAVGDLQRAVGMDDGDVAGVEPVVVVGRVLVLLEIALDDPRPARLQPARATRRRAAGRCPRRRRSAARPRTATGPAARYSRPARRRSSRPSWPAARRRCRSATFRSCPRRGRPRMPRSRNQRIIARGAAEPPMVTMLERRRAARRCARYARSCVSQTVGTPAEWRDLLLVEQLAHRARADSRRDRTSLQPGHRRRLGHAPGVGVEHRHDRQHHRPAPTGRRCRARRSPWRGAWSSDARRARPWDCRSCRWCSKARTGRARRPRPSDNRRPRRRSIRGSRSRPRSDRSRCNARSSSTCGFIRSTSGAKARS